MSSILSQPSPLLRNRRTMIVLNQHSRNTLSRMFKHKTFKEEILAFYARQSEGLPIIPNYLRSTVYAELVSQQYQIYTKICQTTDKKDKKECVYESTRKIPSSQEYDALQALLTSDSFKLSLAMQDLRLPTAWDIRAKGNFIDISLDHMQLTYRGNGKDDPEVSSARANHAMRKQKINSLDRLPGWEENSWGYHGENGQIFSGPGTGKNYGPRYGTGDIIGCGVDFRDMSAFYTKNGIYLGTAFRKIKEVGLYPFVGFKTCGEQIEANFGTKPFKFDIQQWMMNEKQELMNQIGLQSTISTIADQLVLEYLRHHGYTQSAKALEKTMPTPCSQSEDKAQVSYRQKIRHAVMEGDIEEAMVLCETHYPGVLRNNPFVLFRLECRNFMEMVKRAQKEHQWMDTAEEETQSLHVAHSLSSKREMNQNGYVRQKKQRISNLELFDSIMTYGSRLRQTYAEQAETDETIRKELMTTFSILAYSDLSHAAVAYLYETPCIEQVASELNSAILVSLGKYPNSSLERIYRQTNTAIEELVMVGNAKAAMLRPEHDCLQN
ncbi:CTLH/CRA C-terminal to lish motif domain-containing protein [Blakeslea trispora]|nr:CTLH/CRA C-terminal to lish motif domain-containing protein [Blakeslea trispora]